MRAALRRPGVRLARVALAAFAVAAWATVASAVPASATSTARVLAASLVTRQLGHHGLRGPAPDRALVLGAWRDAGVDIRTLDTPLGLLHACTLLDSAAARPAGPAPADYLLYRDGAGSDRIGMFLSPVDVAVVDRGTVALVPLPELAGAIGDAPVERVLAGAGSAHACRLAPQRWPGGRDDTSLAPGRVALADPAQLAAQISWAAAHPRDADTGVLHPIARIAASLAAGVSGVLSQLIGAAFNLAHAVLEHLGPIGAPFLFVGGLLGRTFDGRRLHGVLTAVVLTALAIALGLGWILPFGWVLVGATLGGAAASAAGVPVLGAIGGAMVGAAFAVASFLTGVLTGVDGSSRVAVGTVLFALLADLVWVRPALSALGLAAHLHGGGGLLGTLAARIESFPLVRTVVGDGRSMLDLSSSAGDAMSMRPRALFHAAQVLATRGVPPVETGTALARAMAAVPPAHDAVTAAEAASTATGRALDLVSLAWRPSSLPSDLVGHAADALHFLDTEMRTGLPSLPQVRGWLLRLPGDQRSALLDVLSHASTHVVPQLQITARLSHLHSGARTATSIATGQHRAAPWLRAWRSPVSRLVLRGLPWRSGYAQ